MNEASGQLSWLVYAALPTVMFVGMALFGTVLAVKSGPR